MRFAQPALPLSVKGYKDVVCHICNFAQPLENRPDVMGMAHGGGHGQMQHPPPGNMPPQGWGQQPPPHHGPRYG
jgi:hypothetical protein